MRVSEFRQQRSMQQLQKCFVAWRTFVNQSTTLRDHVRQLIKFEPVGSADGQAMASLSTQRSAAADAAAILAGKPAPHSTELSRFGPSPAKTLAAAAAASQATAIALQSNEAEGGEESRTGRIADPAADDEDDEPDSEGEMEEALGTPSSSPRVASAPEEEFLSPLRAEGGSVSPEFKTPRSTPLTVSPARLGLGNVQPFRFSQAGAGLVPQALLMRGVTEETLALLSDGDGRITSPEALCTAVYHGGCQPATRRLVWKTLLDQYTFGMSHTERQLRDNQLQRAYAALKDEWSPLLAPEVVDYHLENEMSFNAQCNLIDLDVSRSDFRPDESGEIANQLRAILRSYVYKHRYPGYVQGMAGWLWLGRVHWVC